MATQGEGKQIVQIVHLHVATGFSLVVKQGCGFGVF